MIRLREPLYRPPAEAESLIFQAAFGCPHNSCRFCGMYKHVPYEIRSFKELSAEIREAGDNFPETGRVFLADGDVMNLPAEHLIRILRELNAAFPRLARVNLYANGSSILAKTPNELAELRSLRLHTLYMGLESGSQQVLDRFGKRESVEGMIRAQEMLRSAGLKSSVMILTGLGGRELRWEHIVRTAEALNRMQVNLLSALRFIPFPGLPLPAGYTPVTEYQAVEELREIVARLDLKKTVFRANHSSNPVPLAGRFPNDRERILAELEGELRSGALDSHGIGRFPFLV